MTPLAWILIAFASAACIGFSVAVYESRLERRMRRRLAAAPEPILFPPIADWQEAKARAFEREAITPLGHTRVGIDPRNEATRVEGIDRAA